MATGSTNNNVPQNNPWLSTLVSDGKWINPNGGPLELTYNFRSGTVPNVYAEEFGFSRGAAWQAFEREALERALKSWSDVADITFRKVGDGDENANLQQWVADLRSDGSLGWHYMPRAGVTILNGAYNSRAPDWNMASLQAGGYNYITMVHELGHALGLRHPHADDFGEPAFPGVDDSQDMGQDKLNQGIFTLMSYIDGWRDRFPNHRDPNFGWTATPMAFDVAAIQAIYGANMSHKTGHDTYALPAANGAGTYWSCIWDAGGIDTISAVNARGNSTIDLRDAPLTGANAGGYLSWVGGIIGGFTIAKGAVIENAIGGAMNDVITGNQVDNSLTGGNGNDTMDGGAGHDSINGGAGADNMAGGAGNDTFIVNNIRDTITETTDGGTDTVQASISFSLAGSNLENLTLTGSRNIDGYGNAADNVLTGNVGNNILSGREGNDTLIGGGGSDVLRGGAGNDSFVFDSLLSRNNIDRITDFVSGSDVIRLEDGIFSALGEVFDAAEFFLGTSASDAMHRIIYDQTSGGLFYDADGAGTGAAVQFAVLVNRANITHTDFMII